MSIIEALLDNAHQDTQLLIRNDELGDDFSRSRPVDFILKGPDKTLAETVCSFINDNQYGVATIEADPNGARVRVTVEMPVTQNILCSVSGLMTCIASLFGLKYDGWGCVIQKQGHRP